MKKMTPVKISVIVISFILVFLFVLTPFLTAIVYECVFSDRFETPDFLRYDVSEFEGLAVERSDFYADGGVTLAGYKYSVEGASPKGVAVVCHGLGGGGHNSYMPYIYEFCLGGYYVFAYDVRGNDNSGGKSVEGLPQGVVDLDFALHHILTIEEYEGLPIVLFGHSWGAYSAGSILYMHSDIKAAVLVAGFNESSDLIYHRGERIVGKSAKFILPYVKFYERVKFGKEFSSANVLGGFSKTDAGILIIHSADDTVVPSKYGYDKFYELFGENERFDFRLYEDKGHESAAFFEDTSLINEIIDFYDQNCSRK